MGTMTDGASGKELESLKSEVAQLREIVAALVNLVVENQGAEEAGSEFEDDAFVPEVGTGSRFGWGM